jgi:hypothetical protein
LGSLLFIVELRLSARVSARHPSITFRKNRLQRMLFRRHGSDVRCQRLKLPQSCANLERVSGKKVMSEVPEPENDFGTPGIIGVSILKVCRARRQKVPQTHIRNSLWLVITVGECEATVERIRAVVSVEIPRLPASLCHELAGRDPKYIQQVLGAALRSALERLNRPEIYFKARREESAQRALAGGTSGRTRGD